MPCWQSRDGDRRSSTERLDIETCTGAVAAGVRLHGEVDLCTAGRLAQVLAGLRRDGHRVVVVDLAGVALCDAAGLAVLLRGHLDLRASGAQLVLTSPSPLVWRVLQLSGLGAVLTLDHDIGFGSPNPDIGSPDEVAVPRGCGGEPDARRSEPTNTGIDSARG
jgi:anti-anti-sigma factor